ncbi:MAG: cupin domain-containing protein [Planctomycetes bacterium]|nr:cupin domain-containing protein [Planctomycetota bacterium]
MNSQRLINELGLVEHREGGYFSETFRNHEQIDSEREGEKRSALTSIYYMLTKDRPIGYFHRNLSSIVHYFHGGDPLTYLLIDNKGQLTRKMLGPALSKDCQPQLIVPGGTWKATILEKGDYGLLGEAVAPGFEYCDMTFAKAEDMSKAFPHLWGKIEPYVKS